MEIKIDQLQNQFGAYYNVVITWPSQRNSLYRQFFAIEDVRKFLAIYIEERFGK
jgi:hypothetical protein